MHTSFIKDITYNLENLEWRPFREGVTQVPIFVTENPQGPSARLIRYQPGASVSYHTHPGYEHIITLQGSQTDRAGVSSPGMLVINKPQSGHKISSPSGCVVLGIYEKPVCFCEEPMSHVGEIKDDFIVFDNVWNTNTLQAAPWKNVKGGVNESVFYSEAPGSSCRLLHLKPQANSRERLASGYASILVLDGELTLENASYPTRSLSVWKAGQDLVLTSAEGCLALIAITSESLPC